MSEPVIRLWSTVVGSHAWGMNHEGSDVDAFTCYLIDTHDLLSGEVTIGEKGGAHFSSTPEFDEQRHELWRWVEETMKGNVNYITGVFSPIVRDDEYGLLGMFRCIALRGRSRSIYPSTRGMALSNLHKMEAQGLDGAKEQKKFSASSDSCSSASDG